MKTWLITGISSSIGREILKRLEKKQEEVCVIGQFYSRLEEVEKMKDEFSYVKLVLFQCDLTDETAVAQWISKLQELKYKPTHILHTPASKLEYMRIKEFSWEIAEKELKLQINSLAQLFKVFLPYMEKDHYGKVVAVASACTEGVPPKYMCHYVMTKYALIALIKSAACEYSGKGININAISPNMMETDLLSNIDNRIVEITAKESAMKRNIRVEEVADGIMFLMGETASYINGINLNLTGGDKM